MKEIRCRSCGSTELIKIGEILKCRYCGTEHKSSLTERSLKRTSISLNSDVEALLQKCKHDPKHAKRYANLILDIDPTNQEALKYLK